MVTCETIPKQRNVILLEVMICHEFIFLNNFFICLYPNTGKIHEGHPISEMEQQHKQVHFPFSCLQSGQFIDSI